MRLCAYVKVGCSLIHQHRFAANLVLQDTIERIFVRDVYADITRGIFLVRGENVLLLGEVVRSWMAARLLSAN